MREDQLTTSAVLLRRAQAGDDAAVSALLQRYLPRMRRWAGGRLPAADRGRMDTEDVVQDVVIAALRNLNQVEIRDDGALQAYLRRAVSNRIVDLYRRMPAATQTDLASSFPAPDPSPLELAIGAEAMARYEAALDRLPEGDRQAVILRIEMCCDYEEVAASLRKSSPAHARTAVSRALRRLAREMRHARS